MAINQEKSKLKLSAFKKLSQVISSVNEQSGSAEVCSMVMVWSSRV